MQTTTPTTTTTPAPKMPAIMPTNEPLASAEDTLTTGVGAIGAGVAVCAGIADVLVNGVGFGVVCVGVVLVGVAKPQMLAPSEETFPAAHVVQPPRPVVGLYLPAEHAVHVIAAAWE